MAVPSRHSARDHRAGANRGRRPGRSGSSTHARGHVDAPQRGNSRELAGSRFDLVGDFQGLPAASPPLGLDHPGPGCAARFRGTRRRAQPASAHSRDRARSASPALFRRCCGHCGRHFPRLEPRSGVRSRLRLALQPVAGRPDSQSGGAPDPVGRGLSF
jgi:hypothetical protein